MALALKNAGKKVLVIGLLEGENFLDGEENGRFQGIDYINITQKKVNFHLDLQIIYSSEEKL